MTEEKSYEITSSEQTKGDVIPTDVYFEGKWHKNPLSIVGPEESKERYKGIIKFVREYWLPILIVSIIVFVVFAVASIFAVYAAIIWLIGFIVAFIAQVINRGKFPYLSMFDVVNNSFWSWIYVYLFYTKI